MLNYMREIMDLLLIRQDLVRLILIILKRMNLKITSLILKTGQNCKFRNCNHIKEPKCNVKHLVDEGKLLNLDMSIIYSYLMKSLIERYDING